MLEGISVVGGAGCQKMVENVTAHDPELDGDVRIEKSIEELSKGGHTRRKR